MAFYVQHQNATKNCTSDHDSMIFLQCSLTNDVLMLFQRSPSRSPSNVLRY